MMNDWLTNLAALAIEVAMVIVFDIIASVMIVSVFAIALQNVPDDVLFRDGGTEAVITAFILILGPQLILARTIAWWYDQLAKLRDILIKRLQDGKANSQ